MDFYSHQSFRKLIAAILDEFNDIMIEKIDVNGIRTLKNIPIIFGTGDRSHFFRKTELEQLNKGNFNILPKGSVSLIAMMRADHRNTNRLAKAVEYKKVDGTRDYSMNSVSFDMSFEISFVFKTMTEAAMCIEQIAPRFNPSLVIRYKELDIDIEDTSVPLELDTTEISISDFGSEDVRLINVNFYIRAKSNLYHPITNAALIEKVISKIGATTPDDIDFIDVTEEYL